MTTLRIVAPSRFFNAPLFILALIAIVASQHTIVLAQETALPISTDRPGQTTPPAVLGPGFVQIEAGVQYACDRSDRTELTTLSLPGALARIGLLERMELRLTGEFRNVRAGESDAGAASIGAGTKVGIGAEDGMIPETAFLLTLGLPVGNENFKPQSVAPGFLFAMRNTLWGSANLYYNLGGSWDGTNGAGTGLYSALLGATLVGDLGGFVEIYGSFPAGRPPVHAADAGLSYIVAPGLQLDLFGGTGITDNTTDYFLNAGASLRLPR